MKLPSIKDVAETFSFQYETYSIKEVKEFLAEKGLAVRLR